MKLLFGVILIICLDVKNPIILAAYSAVINQVKCENDDSMGERLG